MLRRLVVFASLFTFAACGDDSMATDEADAPAGAGTVALTAPAAERGQVHIVRLVARGDRYAFEPAEIVAAPGSVVRFVQTGFQPESVGFDASGAPPEAAEFIASSGIDRGPLLTEPGGYYDVVLSDAPPGEYRFYSIPHREHGMVGRLIVEP
jgi:plastocyanin